MEVWKEGGGSTLPDRFWDTGDLFTAGLASGLSDSRLLGGNRAGWWWDSDRCLSYSGINE